MTSTRAQGPGDDTLLDQLVDLSVDVVDSTVGNEVWRDPDAYGTR